ncbi:probable cysteine--tRNA ligase, mitochondrial isoform X2 [Amia ocellicauda]|uniref:probable cysteine--tRNA ligase, mitochondrial isoform X2 n=1 Tax=Amia ocellicauda TaxID=2972642 RepID=UPI0034644D3E
MLKHISGYHEYMHACMNRDCLLLLLLKYTHTGMRTLTSLMPYWRVSRACLLGSSLYRHIGIRAGLSGRVVHRHSGLCTTASDICCDGGEKKWQKPTGYDTGIETYNSLTKRKEALILAKEGTATWYSCGPTVYDHAHLGHACSYVRFDILQRILSRVFGINIVHVMVITDIDDKIIKRASEENVPPLVLARLYEEEFKNDMEALKVLPPTVYMRVTDNIPQIIAFIEGIINNKHAYVTSKGNVYFDIKSIGNQYGKMIRMGETEGEPGDSDKSDARDFALWKASKPQEPNWVSPWGQGRPGWHIECSTIASSVFGSQLDIHSGGIDLAFPHHENEIAQCEAYHQCSQWGNYFLHSGHLHLKGSADKMSKSLKNYITIKDFLQSYTANEFRMFCLLTKYRSAIDYSNTSMTVAKSVLSSISSFFDDSNAYIKGQHLCQAVDEGVLWERLATTKVNVQKALANDFDTPRAVDAIMSLIHHSNQQLQGVAKGRSCRSPVVFGAIQSYITTFLDVVGFDLQDRQAKGGGSTNSLHNVVEQLVKFRSQVRRYALAVDELAALSSESSQPTQEEKAKIKQRKRELIAERECLLIACDVFRQDLAPFGIHIKDRGNSSTWEITEKRLEMLKHDGTSE